MFAQGPVSILFPTHAVKVKIHFLVSLHTLSSQDRGLSKEAFLVITAACTCGEGKRREGIPNCKGQQVS